MNLGAGQCRGRRAVQGAWIPEEVGRASPTGNDRPAQPEGRPPWAGWLAAASSQ